MQDIHYTVQCPVFYLDSLDPGFNIKNINYKVIKIILYYRLFIDDIKIDFYFYFTFGKGEVQLCKC